MALAIYNLFLRFISFVLPLLGKNRKYIVFESFPDYSGSPKMICLELEKRGFRSKYRFVWAIDKSQKCLFKDYECIPFWGDLNFFERLKKNLIAWNALLIVDSNRAVLKHNSNSFRIYTRHGGTLKNCTNILRECGRMDYCLSLSDEIADLDYQLFKNYWINDRSQVLSLGYPANDEIFSDCDMTIFWKKTLNRCASFEKKIGWFPTFRQRRIDCGDDMEFVFPYGIPLVNDETELNELNELLAKEEVLLVIQIHHAQKRLFNVTDMSNIVVVNQSLKDECSVTNANLMHDFDALITDYSAAYHEFVLLDRPLAISIDDYDEYSKRVGFSFDFFDYIRGFYLKDMNDLKQFISEVAENIDSTRDQRHVSLEKIHKYKDANSTQRVVDFLCEKVKL